MSTLEKLYSDKINNEVSYLAARIEKVLCIVEGKDELSFLKRIYELVKNTNITCKDFCNNVVVLSYGKNPIRWIGATISEQNDNEMKCNFQGGNLDGCPVPTPILEALNKEDLELYSSIIIMFDKDCDPLNSVEDSVRRILTESGIKLFSLLTPDPCFEKICISIYSRGLDSDQYISSKYKIIRSSHCKWYKNNFKKIPKKIEFASMKTLNDLIGNLSLDHLFSNTTIDSNLTTFLDSAKLSFNKLS